VAARLKQLQGVVIDGAIRDVARIRRDRLPVFARSVVPNAGGAEYIGELNIPIQCGGVVVNPGDWVVGDEDGVVVIPANRLSNVLKKAELLGQIEKQIERAVRRGQDLASILRYHEALERKSREPVLPQMRFTQRGS
jgi:regulator of RNase E activity RraA